MRSVRVPWLVLPLLSCIAAPEPSQGESTSTTSVAATTSGDTTTSSTTFTPLHDLGAADGSSSTTGSPRPATPSCPAVRSESDRPDVDDGLPEVQVFYVLPSDGTDESLDTSDRICNSVLAFNDWLDEQTGGSRFRLDVADGELDITFVRLDRTDAEMHGTDEAASIDTGVAYVRDRIERELVLGNWLQPHELAAVYYGGTSSYACGGGAWPPALVGRVAALYLGGEIAGFDACDSAMWGRPDQAPGYLDYAMLHEIMHTLGLVGATAPHEHSTGHVYDRAPSPERDLMYSPRPGEADAPWGVYDAAGLALDLGGDDYYGHGIPGVPDLARSALLEPLPDDAELPPGW